MPVFGHWDGYKWNDTNANKKIPSFQVRKNRSVLKGGICTCVVSLGSNGAETSFYEIRGSPEKSAFKITSTDGMVVAEVRLL